MLPPPSRRNAGPAKRTAAFMEEHIYPAESLFEPRESAICRITCALAES